MLRRGEKRKKPEPRPPKPKLPREILLEKAQRGIWITSSGREISITDMNWYHLNSCLNVIHRRKRYVETDEIYEPQLVEEIRKREEEYKEREMRMMSEEESRKEE